MNKKQFVTYIATQYNCTKIEAKKVVDIFTSSLIENIKNYNEIVFNGFGKFYKLTVPSKIGRNPKNGQSVNISKTVYPRFIISKKFKDICNK